MGLPLSSAEAPNRLVAAYGLYYLDGRPIIVRSADVPYFRLPPERWGECLLALRATGCNAVASDIPWAWHAPRPTEIDLDGRTDPRRGLSRFLDAVTQAGLVFLARPGPDTRLSPTPGHPTWLAEAIPEALARRRDGRPERSPRGAVFSLLHPAYLGEVERWYGALAASLGPYFTTQVVMWQIGSAAGRAFTNSIGRLDFNPDTVARYRTFLEARYEHPGGLAREWHRRVERFDAVLPPAGPAPAGELQDWQAFLESWVAQHVDHVRQVVRALGYQFPVATSVPAEYVSPQNPRDILSVAHFAGYESDVAAKGARPAHDSPFAGSQHAARLRQFLDDERPLSCWRAEVGLPSEREDTSVGPMLRYVVGGVAHGLKAYSLSTARDHSTAAKPLNGLLHLPSDRRGGGAGAEALTRFQLLLGEIEEELTASVEVQDPIAYLDYAPYSRSTPDDLRRGFHGFGLDFGERARPAGWVPMALHAVLLTAGYNCPFVDLEAATDEVLAEFQAAVFPSRGWLPLDEYGKLVVFTLRGGTLVTFPEPVRRQPDGTPLKTTFLWPHPPSPPRRAHWTDWLLRHRDTGGNSYRVQVRDGTSTVIDGTPGEAYASPRYAAIRPDVRLALRRLAVSLFEDRTPRQIVPDDSLEAEAIARLSPDGGCLLFVVNRLGAQTGRLDFPAPMSLNLHAPVTAQVLFSHLGSMAVGLDSGLQLDLRPGDAMVLRLR